MGKTYEIKELQQVLQPYLGTDQSVVSYVTKPLTQPGENYGSLILAVTVTAENNSTKEQKVLNVVAKMLPPNPKMQAIFNVGVTFKKEINMYTKILHKLKTFAREHNFDKPLDFLCEHYGSRLSLDSTSTTVDDDAVLLFENLTYSGFVMGDRFTGFDIETLKVILNDVAVFHAVPLAFKILKPKEFESEFMPLLKPGFGEPPEQDENMDKKLNEKFIRDATEGNPKCAELSSKIREAVQGAMSRFNDMPPFTHAYGTICHLDLWVNNIMVKYIDGKPVKSKLVDFQGYAYSSFAKDLVFLLFSSVGVPLLKEHFDYLVSFYHKTVLETLQCFDCNTEEYTLEGLYKEMAAVVKTTEAAHIMFMLTPILAERGTISDIEDLEPEVLMQMEGNDAYRKRLADVILILNERQWL